MHCEKKTLVNSHYLRIKQNKKAIIQKSISIPSSKSNSDKRQASKRQINLKRTHITDPKMLTKIIR